MDILNSQWADPVDGFILYLTLLDQTMDKELVVYQDGQHKGNATTKDSTSSSDPSIGRIVVGRLLNGHYASVQVDELLFFNQTLTESEITILSQYTG